MPFLLTLLLLSQSPNQAQAGQFFVYFDSDALHPDPLGSRLTLTCQPTPAGTTCTAPLPAFPAGSYAVRVQQMMSVDATHTIFVAVPFTLSALP